MERAVIVPDNDGLEFRFPEVHEDFRGATPPTCRRRPS
jgi:hypothetical protein